MGTPRGRTSRSGQMGGTGFPFSIRGNRAQRAGAGAGAQGTAPGERLTDGAGAASGGRWVRGWPRAGRQKATGRCSRPDVRGMGVAWEKTACFPAALPRWLLGAGREQGAAGVATSRGNGEAKSWGQVLRASLVEAFYHLLPSNPHPNRPTLFCEVPERYLRNLV